VCVNRIWLALGRAEMIRLLVSPAFPWKKADPVPTSELHEVEAAFAPTGSATKTNTTTPVVTATTPPRFPPTRMPASLTARQHAVNRGRVTGGAGLWEAGGPHSPRPRLARR
jgi:hypothetical protein